MKIKFPVKCITEASRLSFCNRADEMLRLEHDTKGAEYRNGDITQEEWEAYKRDVFMPTFQTIDIERQLQTDQTKQSPHWPIDLARDVRNG